MKPNHLNQDLTEKACSQLRTIAGSLNGLGALFRQVQDDSYFEADELFGIGQLLKNFSLEISELENLVKCGDDNMTRLPERK